jgi:hypothetical protein
MAKNDAETIIKDIKKTIDEKKAAYAAIKAADKKLKALSKLFNKMKTGMTLNISGTEDVSSPEKKAKSPRKKPTFVCPECDQKFSSGPALGKHKKDSGHGKKA